MVTYICTPISHVHVNRRHPLREIMSIVQIDESRTCVIATTLCRANPWIVRTALELREEERLRRSHLPEVGVVVENGVWLWSTVDSKTFAEITRPASRVVVETVDVNFSTYIAVVFGPGLGVEIGIVSGEGHVNSPGSMLLLQKLHVVDRGLIRDPLISIQPLVAVFVLKLPHDHVAAIGDQVRFDKFGHFARVAFPSSCVSRVVIA